MLSDNASPSTGREENNTSEIFEFLSAIRNKDKEKLKNLRFAEEEYVVTLNGMEYKLKNLGGGKAEICEFITHTSDITVPASLDNKKIIGIGKNACYGQHSLKSLTLSNDILYIQPGAFANCINLKKIILNSKLRTLGETNETAKGTPLFLKNHYLGVFANSAIESIDLPESLEIIGDNTFRGCGNLKTIKLPNRIKKISNYCFFNCQRLEQILFPKELYEIENGAFYGCKSLNMVRMPGSLKKIKHFAFQNCNNLTQIVFNDGVKEIGVSAFRGCKKLAKLNLPLSVLNIHKYSFEKNILLE